MSQNQYSIKIHTKLTVGYILDDRDCRRYQLLGTIADILYTMHASPMGSVTDMEEAYILAQQVFPGYYDPDVSYLRTHAHPWWTTRYYYMNILKRLLRTVQVMAQSGLFLAPHVVYFHGSKTATPHENYDEFARISNARLVEVNDAVSLFEIPAVDGGVAFTGAYTLIANLTASDYVTSCMITSHIRIAGFADHTYTPEFFAQFLTALDSYNNAMKSLLVKLHPV